MLAQVVVLMTCISEVLGSNFSHITILTEVFCGFPKFIHLNAEIHHKHFFPSSLNVIILLCILMP
jgi:hypothetical protein